MHVWGRVRCFAGTLTIAVSALACASATPKTAKAPTAPAPAPVAVNDADTAFWECTALELEETAREISINVTGPRAVQHARPSRCVSPDTKLDPRFVGVLPTPKNPELAKLDVAELMKRAVALDPNMRIELDEYGGVEVRSRERRVLQAKLRATQTFVRPVLAGELETRLEMASELAVRLAPLGRTFARAHAATQLVHTKLATMSVTSFETAGFTGHPRSEAYLRVATAARSIERVAAATTALLSLSQGGLEARVSDRALLETARRVRDTLSRPAQVPEQVVLIEWSQIAARLRDNPGAVAAFSRVPGTPMSPPTLGDIADAADVRGADMSLLIDLWKGDYRLVPEALVSVLPDSSAPRASAESVRAVLDGRIDVALCQARALLRDQSDLSSWLMETENVLALGRTEQRPGKRGG